MAVSRNNVRQYKIFFQKLAYYNEAYISYFKSWLNLFYMVTAKYLPYR